MAVKTKEKNRPTSLKKTARRSGQTKASTSHAKAGKASSHTTAPRRTPKAATSRRPTPKPASKTTEKPKTQPKPLGKNATKTVPPKKKATEVKKATSARQAAKKATSTPKAAKKTTSAPAASSAKSQAPAKKATQSAGPEKRGKKPKTATPSSTVDALVEEIESPRAQEEAPPRELERLSGYDGDTAFKLYLREIGQTKLLTPEEEVQLAARIKKGDKQAREQMIKANLRLVVKIAHDYEGFGLPLLDLINEGNVGLMKAVERFDPAKGGKLSTYGAWWIKQSIKRALANQSKTIRLPVHLVDKISKMRRTALKLQEEYGREPTDEELGKELGITAARVAQLRTAAIRPASLDAPASEDDSNNFSERVQDENAQTPYKHLEDQTVVTMLQDMIKTLPERESTILSHRFGLDGAQEKTLEEVGAQFGVTRERVRQIQNIALAKLRKMIEKLEAAHDS